MNFRIKSSKEDLIFILNSLNLKMNYKKIHIVGTNGKGSSCKFLEDNLNDNKIKNASFTSPHLLKVNERIKINGVAVSEKKILKIINEEIIAKFPKIKLNFFAYIFIAALIIFDQYKIKVVIFEAGIGAKEDIVNLLEHDITIFTSISLDHESILGNSVKNIAADKAYAIKHNNHIYYPSTLKRSAKQQLLKRADDKNNENIFEIVLHEKIDIYKQNYEVIKEVLKNEFKIDSTTFAIKYGRMSSIKINDKLCIIDVSHNYDGIHKTLILLKKRKQMPKQIVVSFSGDRNVKKILKLFDKKNTFIYQNNSPIATNIHEYGEGFNKIENLNQFLKKLKTETLFIGSHYFISEVLKNEKYVEKK
ncbi:MAG: hypothetical protein ACRCRZ_00705 [Metamycoplasmataceae bacterium]